MSATSSRRLPLPAGLPIGLAFWLGSVVCAVALSVTRPAAADDWPAWRGPTGTGIAAESNQPPTTWDAETGIRWQVALPGPGNGSPICVGNRVFLTQFDPETRERLLLCFDLATGRELWRHAEKSETDEWTHPSNPLCAASPASDGKSVVAFLGQAGLICTSLDGELRWKREWGIPQHLFGGGASPIIYDGVCIFVFGPGREQFYAAVDMSTGEDLWRVAMPRVDAPNPLEGPDAPPLPKETDLRDPFGSWATPLVVPTDVGTQIVLLMPGELRAVEPRTGDTIWSCGGPGAQVLTSPTVNGQRVVMQSETALAIECDGRGDVSDSHVVWRQENDPGRIGSPIVVGGRVYGITMNGIVDCCDLGDGSRLWRERLRESGGRGGSWTSLVACGDLLYALTQTGTTFVFRASDEFEQVAVNPLGEPTNASPAIVEGAILIRTNGHLWCVEG